jgi:hypothetical protein
MDSVIKSVRVSEEMVQVIIPDYIPPDDPVLLRARALVHERCSPEGIAAFEASVEKWTSK